MPVSYSPNVNLSKQTGDVVLITTGQSNDMFWGPVAMTTQMADCFFLNVRASVNPPQWTINQGRDTLQSVPGGYVIPGDNELYFPPLVHGQYRGGSPWTQFMAWWQSTPQGQRPKNVGGHPVGRLIVAQCGQHAAPMSEFLPGTPNFNRVIAARDLLASYGWNVTYINHAQGEAQSWGLIPKAQTKAQIWQMVDGYRAAGLNAPVILDTVSMCRSMPGTGAYAGDMFENIANWQARGDRYQYERETQDAQREALDDTRKIFRGVNADQVLGRIDGTHMGTLAQQTLAYLRFRDLYGHFSAGRILSNN